jgi:hypothetical protein
MQDIIYVAITMAFFAICVAYVRGLDRLVRSGEESERSTDLVDADMVDAGAGEVVHS